MGSTHTRLLFHVVFATHERQRRLSVPVRERLFPYLGGFLRNAGGIPVQVGGMPDHLHLLFYWRADQAISDLMRDLKRRSSRWVSANFDELREFHWQEGYAAFTVSESQKERVAEYVRNQEEHHRQRSALDELEELLRAHGVEFDAKYL